MKKNYVLPMVFFIMSNALAQTDIDDSEDYPLLDRLPGYSIAKYAKNEFDSHRFFYDQKSHIKEGRKLTIEYRYDLWNKKDYQFPTRLQILRNYSNAIKKAGGRVLFERHNAEHGYYSFITSDQKEIWIQVKPASTGKSYKLIIVEESNMRQDIVVDAELIKNTIELQGRIAVYGILFDTGKSVVKEESEPALRQIAEYLKNNPTVNCWVVGHTDSEGSFQTNSELSLSRARAVKKVLQLKYNIAKDRLYAEGVGPLSPIATNANDEGKRLNRRVELVKK